MRIRQFSKPEVVSARPGRENKMYKQERRKLILYIYIYICWLSWLVADKRQKAKAKDG